MAQGQFSGNLYFIDQDETATLSGIHFFHTLVNGDTAVEVTVKGGGLFEFIDIDGANAATVVKYINPDTGVAFPGIVDGSAADLADGKTAAFFERVATETITISLGPNQIVCGRFTQVAVADTSNAEVHAYTG